MRNKWTSNLLKCVLNIFKRETQKQQRASLCTEIFRYLRSQAADRKLKELIISSARRSLYSSLACKNLISAYLKITHHCSTNVFVLKQKRKLCVLQRWKKSINTLLLKSIFQVSVIYFTIYFSDYFLLTLLLTFYTNICTFYFLYFQTRLVPLVLIWIRWITIR